MPRFDPLSKYGGVGVLDRFDPDDFVVVLQHPVTTEYYGGANKLKSAYRLSKN